MRNRSIPHNTFELLIVNVGVLGSHKELKRLHGAVCRACEVIKKSGAAKHLNMNDISVSVLCIIPAIVGMGFL